MIRLYKYILFSFLLLPKVPLSETTGIMLGEILLFLFTSAVLLINHKVIIFKPLVIVLLSFFTWFILTSSVLNGLLYTTIPISAIVYYAKILNYFMLFWVAYRLYIVIGYDGSCRVFISAYLMHYIIAMGIVVIYYVTHRPSVGDILWNYETGLRAIPLAGLSISPSHFAGLATIGGGSSNLFVSWSLAFALVVLLTENKRRGFYLFLSFLVPLAGMSRGGILTFVLFLLYIMFLSKFYPFIQKSKLLFFTFLITIGTSFMISNSDINIPNVFERISQTIQGGSSTRFDPSTQGRFENYNLVFSAWSSNPSSILFGLGMDEEHLIKMTGWGLVESFFLQVLFCGGIIGIIILLSFFALVYLNRKRNIWFYSLWLFILFESLLMWSITGGDFYSAHVMYVIMVLLGYGHAEAELQRERQLNLIP